MPKSRKKAEKDPIEGIFYAVVLPLLGAGVVVGVILSAIVAGIVWLIV